MKEIAFEESPVTSRYRLSNNYYAIPGLKEKYGLSYQSIVETILNYCGFKHITQIATKSRRRELVYCRQLCFYFLNKETQLTKTQIGLLFGGRDHTTTIHGLVTINNLMETDDKVRQDVERIEHLL